MTSKKNRYKYTFNKLLEFSKISNALIQNIIANASTSKTNDDSRNKSSDFSTNSSEDKNINLTLLTSSRLSFKLLAQIIFVLLKLHKKIKMANFDIKTATGLVPTYDGSPDTFNAFEDASTLLFELNPNHEEMLVKLIRTRLTGKARIGLPSNITTFN